MNKVDFTEYCLNKDDLPYEVSYYVKLLSSDGYIKSLQNQLQTIYPDYSKTVYNKCRDATAWAIGHLAKKNKSYLFSFKVLEGYVEGKHHVWLKVKDYYIDLTLAQFFPNAPREAVFKENDVKESLYVGVEEYKIKDWIALESKREF